MKNKLTSKQKLGIAATLTLLVGVLPIHPFWLGCVLSCIGGFATGTYFIDVLKEKGEENE